MAPLLPLLVKLSPLLVPVLSIIDRLVGRIPMNGKKTETAATLKVLLLPLVALVFPALGETPAGAMVDTAVELVLAVALVHRLAKLLLAQVKEAKK